MFFKPRFICVTYQNNFDGIVSTYIFKGYRQAYAQLLDLYDDDEIMEPDRGLGNPPEFDDFKREMKRNRLRYKFEGYHYEAEFIQPLNR